MGSKVNDGFMKASSQNLPKIDLDMLGEYICFCGSFRSPELRNVKTFRSMRPNYGDVAIGYVQLQRLNPLCTVEAKICPEHRVGSKNYSVRVVIDEEEDLIIEAVCQDCAASEGGCKHAIAVLAWIYRRSEEPSPTSVTCYWKKPALSGIGTSTKYSTLKTMIASKGRRDLDAPKAKQASNDNSFLQKVLDDKRSKGSGSHLVLFFSKNTVQICSLHHQALLFSGDRGDFEAFLTFYKTVLTLGNRAYISRFTNEQSGCMAWFELRYGRITASILYDAATCKTLDGCLIEKILSLNNIDTPAMMRGRQLENEVLVEVERILVEESSLNEGKVSKCGLLLSDEFPALGASPDGVTKHFVLEVKCPSKEQTIKNYHDGEQIKSRYKAQIQLQMLFAGKKVGLFCVAAPDFETSREVKIHREAFDPNYLAALIRRAMFFWRDAVFPRLMQK